MDKWQELQNKINVWADETFGSEVNINAMIEHIMEEVQELKDDPYNPVNFADILILVLRLAQKLELTTDDLHEISEAKFVINSTERIWNIDANGKRYRALKNENV